MNNPKIKTREEIEFKAGLILGQLQREGYTPHEAAELAILLSVYLIERASNNRSAALEATIKALRNEVQLGN